MNNTKKIKETTRKRCPSCDSNNFSVKYNIICDWEKLSSPMCLTICNKCGLGFYDKCLTQAQIEALYDDSYFQSDWCWHGKPYEEVWHKRMEEFKHKQLPWIKAIRNNGRVVDIGCGGGAIVKAFVETGYEAMGIEINDKLSQFGRDTLGVNIINADFTDDDFIHKYGKFDIIYMGDFIEHINEPKIFLLKIINILNNDGYIVMDVPLWELNRFSSILKLFIVNMRRSAFRFATKPYHLIFFKPNTLMALCKNSGYKIVGMKTWKEETGERLNILQDGYLSDRLNRLMSNIFKGCFDDRAFVVLERGRE